MHNKNYNNKVSVKNYNNHMYKNYNMVEAIRTPLEWEHTETSTSRSTKLGTAN